MILEKRAQIIKKLCIKIIKSSKSKKDAINKLMEVKIKERNINYEEANRICNTFKEYFINNHNYEKYSNNESGYNKMRRKKLKK